MSKQWLVMPVLALTAALGQAAYAAGPSPVDASLLAAHRGIGIATTVPHKLLKTYISGGPGGGTLAAGMNVIETRTITCTNAGGCTFGQESMVQLAPNGGDWAICLAVDGFYSTCQWQGNLPVGTWVVGNARGNVTVPVGNHTVTTEVFVSIAGNLAQWQTDHRIYKP